MKQILKEYTGYNIWANEIIISFIKQLSPEQLHLQQNSSFSTIKKTMSHIVDCEYNWLKRINGNSEPEYKAASFDDATSLSQFWIDQSKQFAEVVKKADENSLQQVIAYKNIKGDPFESKLYKIIMHVINHSTYHRGQLVTMLRGAGFTALSSTDLINFYRL